MFDTLTHSIFFSQCSFRVPNRRTGLVLSDRPIRYAKQKRFERYHLENVTIQKWNNERAEIIIDPEVQWPQSQRALNCCLIKSVIIQNIFFNLVIRAEFQNKSDIPRDGAVLWVGYYIVNTSSFLISNAFYRAFAQWARPKPCRSRKHLL